MPRWIEVVSLTTLRCCRQLARLNACLLADAPLVLATEKQVADSTLEAALGVFPDRVPGVLKGALPRLAFAFALAADRLGAALGRLVLRPPLGPRWPSSSLRPPRARRRARVRVIRLDVRLGLVRARVGRVAASTGVDEVVVLPSAL